MSSGIVLIVSAWFELVLLAYIKQQQQQQQGLKGGMGGVGWGWGGSNGFQQVWFYHSVSDSDSLFKPKSGLNKIKADHLLLKLVLNFVQLGLHLL